MKIAVEVLISVLRDLGLILVGFWLGYSVCLDVTNYPKVPPTPIKSEKTDGK